MDLNGLVFKYPYFTEVVAEVGESAVAFIPLRKVSGSLLILKSPNLNGESICFLIFCCFSERFIFPKR